MVDTFTKEQRSWAMSRIRSRHTKPEIIVRSLLHRQGFRFRIHGNKLPGSPDVVLPKYKTAVFVHGCFWHQHECLQGKKPKTNQSYWDDKFLKNLARDQKKIQQLSHLGWRVLVIWECEILKNPLDAVRCLGEKIRGKTSVNSLEYLDKREVINYAAEKNVRYITSADKSKNKPPMSPIKSSPKAQ